jgi:hypothetical protein
MKDMVSGWGVHGPPRSGGGPALAWHGARGPAQDVGEARPGPRRCEASRREQNANTTPTDHRLQRRPNAPAAAPDMRPDQE